MHTLDGKELLAVVSHDTTRKKSGIASHNYDGIHGDFATICFKAADYDRRPKQGENIRFDGKLYKVDSCSISMGMITLGVGAYRMGGAG